MSFLRRSLAVLVIVLVLVVVARTSVAVHLSFLNLAAEGGSDLAVTKTGPSSAPANSDVSFTINVTNLGPDSAPIVTLQDVIPAGMTFVSVTETSNPKLFSCSAPVPTAWNMCTATNFAAGASSDFTVVLHVGEAEPGASFTNVARVTVTSDTTPGPEDPPLDPNDENNSSAASFTIPGATSADLVATKSGPANALPNSNVQFNIVISNGGPDAAQNVSFTDTLPGNMTFVSISQGSGPTFDCSSAPAPGNSGTVTCTLATMNAGATAAFTLTTHIPAESSGNEYTNEVTVSSSTPDPGPENNTGVTSLVASSADVGITKTGPANAVGGNQITWLLTLTNVAPSDTAINATFVDQLPSGTTFVSLNHVAGTAPDSCSTPSPGQNGVVSCSVGVLASGASSQYSLTANISSNVANGSVINNTVTGSSENADPNPNNNSSTFATTVNTSADLSVTKVDLPDPVTAGTNLTYTITLNNAGPSNATSVSLSDTLPAGTTFVSLSSPGGWSCPVPAVGASGTVSCSNASQVVGNAVFMLTVAVASSVSGGTEITNTATASSASSDPNPNNNSGTAVTTVAASPANVTGTKTASGTFTAGSTVSYTVVVTNNGQATQGDNPGNEFNDVLPASLTLVSANATAGTAAATVVTNTVTWNGSIAGGGSVTITITATIKTTNAFGATISNQGTISYDGDKNGSNEANRVTDDPSIGGASDPTSFTVAGQPAISIDNVSQAEGNSAVTNYTFNVTLNAASALTVTVDYATANGTATAPSDYTALTTTTLTFNPGDVTKTVTVAVNGDTTNESDETFFVNLTNPVNATIADNQGLGTILNDDTPSISFSQAAYVGAEDGLHIDITVNRLGDASAAASVDYETTDLFGLANCSVINGNASDRCDYLAALGTLEFAAGQTSRTFRVFVSDDVRIEGNELLTLTLSNPAGTILGATSTATLTITDHAVAPGTANPIDGSAFFIRMLYIDILSREPDTIGFQNWLDTLNGCPNGGFGNVNTTCDRVHVAQSFFHSREFGERGYFIYRFYDAGLGARPTYKEFLRGMQQIGGSLSPADSTAAKMEFIDDLIASPEFQAIYAGLLVPAQANAFISKLEMTSGVTIPEPLRTQLVSNMANGNKTPAETLRAFMESPAIFDAFYNRGFVSMLYFGYLHRDPDTAGFNNWLQQLNTTNNFRNLTFGFIYSTEYRGRFGP